MSKLDIFNFNKDLVELIEQESQISDTLTNSELFTNEVAIQLTMNGRITDHIYEEFGTDQINAFAIDEGESITLFVTDYYPDKDIYKISKEEIDELRKGAIKFLQKIINEEISFDKKTPYFKNLDYLTKNLKDIPQSSKCMINIITNREYLQKYLPENKNVGQFRIETKLYDINQLAELYNDDLPEQSIDINFIKLDHSRKVNCIKIQSDDNKIKSFLATIPASIIKDIYRKHGKEIFNANVRSYLKDTSKINKGIKKTIQTEPSLFFSYNNGLSIIADEVKYMARGQEIYITEIKGMQIVNGGQTATTIYFAFRDQVNMHSSFSVPAKITEINKKHKKRHEILSNIAMYNNSQNAVSIPDLYSNHSYLIAFEKASKDYKTLDNKTWFFERKRGDYSLKEMAVSKSKSAKAKFKSLDLKSKRIDKTQLALYSKMWEQKPYDVALGAARCFAKFIEDFQDEEINISEKSYKRTIAIAILFKVIDSRAKILKLQAGIKRAACSYLVSYISFLTDGSINYEYIWKNQNLSTEFEEKLDDLLIRINDFLIEENPGKLLTEWTKTQKCWKAIISSKIIRKTDLKFVEFE